METNSSLDNIIRRVTSVTREVIDKDDHDKVLYTDEITAEEYVAEVAGYLYRRYVSKSEGLWLRMAYDYTLGVKCLRSASESNGIKTNYRLHY